MSLIFFDGMTNANLIQKPEWDAGFAFVMQPGRDGSTNGSGWCDTPGPVTAGSKTLTLPSAAATLTMGIAIRWLTNYTQGGFVMTFRTGAPGSTTDVLTLLINASNFFEIRNAASNVVLATSSTPITSGAWQHVQVRLKAHASAGSAEVRLDGISVLTFSGVTAAVTADITQVNFRAASNQVQVPLDDIWICDQVDATATQGRANNNFLGDLKVTALLPNAAGDNAAWTPNPAVANFTAVDENPPNTTDYVSGLAASGVRDLYQMSDIAPTVTAVYGLRTTLYAQKSDAGDAFIKEAIKEPAGVNLSVPLGVSASWAAVHAPYRWVKTNGTVWTAAELNAIQAGYDAA